MTFAKVKLPLYAMNAIELVTFSRKVVLQLTDDPHFPDPHPELEFVNSVIDVSHAANLAAMNGGKLQYARKQTAFEELKRTMRALAAYVDSQAKGDPDMIMSAGFEIHKKRKPVGQLPKPKGLKAKVSNFSGTIELKWERMESCRQYTVYMKYGEPDDGQPWIPVAATTKSKCTIDHLEPGTFYWFRITGFNTAGISPPSNPARGLAA